MEPRTDLVAFRDSLRMSVAIMIVPLEEPAESFHPLPKVSSAPACSKDLMVAEGQQRQRQQGRLAGLLKRGRNLLRPSMSSGFEWGASPRHLGEEALLHLLQELSRGLEGEDEQAVLRARWREFLKGARGSL